MATDFDPEPHPLEPFVLNRMEELAGEQNVLSLAADLAGGPDRLTNDNINAYKTVARDVLERMLRQGKLSRRGDWYMLAESETINLNIECMNRSNCREGLKGVAVRNQAGELHTIAWTEWDANSRLVVHLESGRKFLAWGLDLAGPWPVSCCKPATKNRFNSINGRWLRVRQPKCKPSIFPDWVNEPNR